MVLFRSNSQRSEITITLTFSSLDTALQAKNLLKKPNQHLLFPIRTEKDFLMSKTYGLEEQLTENRTWPLYDLNYASIAFIGCGCMHSEIFN